MDLRTMSERAGEIALLLAPLSLFWLCAWGFRRLSPKPRPGDVLGYPDAGSVGIASVIFGALILFGGPFVSDLSRPGQWQPWVLLWASFISAGVWMLSGALGVRARFNRTGIEVRDWRGRWRRFAWRQIRQVRRDWSNSGVVLVFEDRSKFNLWPGMVGSIELIEAAREAGVPGAAELFTRPGDRKRR